MSEFLELLPPNLALKTLLEALSQHTPGVEVLPTWEAAGRVLGADIASGEDLPSFDRSTVDGFSVIAKDTFGASDSLPVYLKMTGEVKMGERPGFSLRPGECALIYTGGMLPDGSDAVVMVENTQQARHGEVEVLRAAAPGENILRRGEDVRMGEVVTPAGSLLRPAEIGGLLALGITPVPVIKKPLIAILSSGDEVINPEETPQAGQVRDVNSYSLSAYIQERGGIARRYGILPDRQQALEQALERALNECDAVVFTAGSSASTRDLTAKVISRMGPPGVLVHGVNIKPGKPTILGIAKGKPVIGLPGNPVSALVIARLFLRPVIAYLYGKNQPEEMPIAQAVLTINVSSQTGREDWIPVRLERQAGVFKAVPIFFKSNLIFTLAKADGLIRIPPDANGLEAGILVEVFPL